jgi:hypothetical protein
MDSKIKDTIKPLLAFCSSEIDIFIYYFCEYHKENVDKISKEDSYLLGILSTSFIWNIKVLKERTYKSAAEMQTEILSNDAYFQNLCKFDGIVDFLIKNIEKDFNAKSHIFKLTYLNEVKQSYFNKTDKEIKELENDIYKII